MSQTIILSGHTGCVMSVVWSPDGQKIASGSCDRTIKIWDMESHELQSTLSGHTDWVMSIAWSPLLLGQKIASASCGFSDNNKNMGCGNFCVS